MGFWSLFQRSWSVEKARRYVVDLAARHARDDYARDHEAAARLTDDDVKNLAEEGFWDVVFPTLEDAGVDAAAEVEGRSIERHYIDALVAAHRARRGEQAG